MIPIRRTILGGIPVFLAIMLLWSAPLCPAEPAGEAVAQEVATGRRLQSSPESQLFPSQQEGRILSADELFFQPVSLDLRNIDVMEALKFLGGKGSLNIVATKNVAGRVTLSLQNVPLKDVFDIMLRSNGLAFVKVGSIYNVMTEAEYKAIYGKNFSDIRQVKMLRLKYAIPEQAFNLLDALKSEIGRILVDQESGNVLIMDTPEKITQLQSALEEFEKRATIEVFVLKYAKAKDVVDILKNRLEAKKVGSITADERNNQVIVQTLPERMQEIAGLITTLDKQTKEVLIDTKIVKIKLTNQLDQGVEWEGLFGLLRDNGLTYLGSTAYSAVQSATAAWRSREQVLRDMGNSIGSYPFSGTTSNYAGGTKVAPGDSLHFGIINNKTDFDVLFKMLNTMGETRLLSNPKIVAINNQEAKIHIGERQAYVTTTTTTGQTTSTISEEVTFVDVGIQLAVTATINDDGYVTMKIRPEVSSVSSTLITPTNNRIPIVDTSLTETTVLAKDGTTVIIGGLRKEERVKAYEQFPFLSKIPILGIPFKSGYGKTERTELLVLLTPHIISGDTLTTGDKRHFRERPIKDYKDYQLIDPEEETGAKQEALPAVEPKSYREHGSLSDKTDQALLAKGLKNEAD